MDDLHLKTRLDQALGGQLEPLRPEVAEIVATGRRAHRRRIATLSSFAVATVTVLVFGTAWLATSSLGRPDSDSVEMATDPSGRPAGVPTVATEEPRAVDLPRTDAEITTACRRAPFSSTAANLLIFDAGRARLVSKAANPVRTWALFESRDGTLWGKCDLREHRTEMAVFRTKVDPTRSEHNVQTDLVCEDGECLTEARLLAKLPTQVRQVQIVFADHQRLIRPTVDGWVAMTYLLHAPSNEPAIRTVTYLGARGNALAEYANTAIPDVKARALPPLSDYPALSEGNRLHYAKGAYLD